MAKLRPAATPSSVQVEKWEMDVVRSVAWSYRTSPDHEEIEAELFKHLLDLKIKRLTGIRDWRGYLARSLYNAAVSIHRKWKTRSRGVLSLSQPIGGKDGSEKPLEDLVASRREHVDLLIEVPAVIKELAPDIQELWHLLVEEQGNVASAARRLGQRPRTVRDRVAKLRAILEKRGLDGAQEPSAVFRPPRVG